MRHQRNGDRAEPTVVVVVDAVFSLVVDPDGHASLQSNLTPQTTVDQLLLTAIGVAARQGVDVEARWAILVAGGLPTVPSPQT